MPDKPHGPYKIFCAQRDLERLRTLAARATALGMRDEFLAALKVINRKLTSEPLIWGDPQYRLSNLGLTICHGIHSLLHVYYAVSSERRMVFVREILALPNSPLADNG
jgi:hypothetical protein